MCSVKEKLINRRTVFFGITNFVCSFVLHVIGILSCHAPHSPDAEAIDPTQALKNKVLCVGGGLNKLSGTQQETTRGPLHNQLHLRVVVTCMAVDHSFLWDRFFSKEKFQ